MSLSTRGRLAAFPVLALAGACLSGRDARAAEIDLFGGVIAAGGRAENPGFVDAPEAGDPRGSLTGSLILRGGLAASWRASRFEAVYTPSADVYEQDDLDRVSHVLTSSWRHDYSPRIALRLAEDASYTPEQNLDPNRLDDGGVLVRRTRAAASRFVGELAFQRSPRTRLLWLYRHTLRAYDAGELVDTSRHDAGFELRRGVARHGFWRAGYEYGLYRFSGGLEAAGAEEPRRGADQHLGRLGWGMELPGGFTASLDAGYERLLPEEPGREDEGGVFVRSELGYDGRRAQAAAGWTRGFTEGGGALENSEAEQAYASIRSEMGRWLTGEIVGTGTTHERIAAGGPPGTVRTFNGTATLTWRLAPSWSTFASWSYFRQASDLAEAAVPELRKRRYVLGVAWSFT